MNVASSILYLSGFVSSVHTCKDTLDIFYLLGGGGNHFPSQDSKSLTLLMKDTSQIAYAIEKTLVGCCIFMPEGPFACPCHYAGHLKQFHNDSKTNEQAC